jgi:carboxypeptidase PM20D1
MPKTPITTLADACKAVVSHPFKMHITKPAAEMFDTLGRHSSFLYKIIFANMWCFSWVIDLLGKTGGGEMNALVRTTTAFTQMEGSDARNVLPTEAKLVSNMRLNPADSVASAVAHLKRSVNNDEVQITVLEANEPSRISETNCPAWDAVASTVLETWPGCIVAPYLMVQCSDSRYYGRISDRVYRFCAMDMTAEERKSIHGNNEKIRLESIAKTVEFYIRLMKKC